MESLSSRPCNLLRRNRLRKTMKSPLLIVRVQNRIDIRYFAAVLAALSIFLAGCRKQSDAVSGTIEVDEVHIGPRMGGRVEAIFAWEGDRLLAGQPAVQLAR